MLNKNFTQLLTSEISRIDAAHTSKRRETIITGFTSDACPRAIINNQPYLVFNSNDYLGLRFHPILKSAEHLASESYGTGPGAVRFISGSLDIYKKLESAVAKFHGRADALVFSSAFAANLAVLFCLIKGQSKDSLVSGKTLVVSDELNHRSIVEGIRVANLPPEQKIIYPHFNYSELDRLLNENVGKFPRVLVVTDGVFSMLGETADLRQLTSLCHKYDANYPEGVQLFVDDCHGIGVLGASGRGVEEVYSSRADVLVGTFGKAFGCDGGYVVADQIVIDYLRESAATYIYSNSLSPGTAGAALAAVNLVASPVGQKLIDQLHTNIEFFKSQAKGNLSLAADSAHAIQPLLIGDAAKTVALKEALFQAGFLVTNINYPVVASGRDEIRVQLSALHSTADLATFLTAVSKNAA